MNDTIQKTSLNRETRLWMEVPVDRGDDDQSSRPAWDKAVVSSSHNPVRIWNQIDSDSTICFMIPREIL